MNTKLTLTIQHTLIEKAKVYAKGQGRSLSDIVENYFKVIVKEEEEEEEVFSKALTPIANSLRGSFKAPADFDYKQELTKALAKKYIKNG